MKLNKLGGVPRSTMLKIENELISLGYNQIDTYHARIDFYKHGLAKTHNKLYNALVNCMKSISDNLEELPYDIDDIFLQLALPM